MSKVDRITQSILDRAERGVPSGLMPGVVVTGLEGDIEVGDEVKTLNRRRAIYGRVKSLCGRGFAIVEGETQPGAGLQRVKVSIEDLELIAKG